MSRFLLVVLALFAVADVQVAFARLKPDVSSSSATSSSPQQIRKAYHSRPHLAEGSVWKDDAENLQIVADFCEISELYQEGL